MAALIRHLLFVSALWTTLMTVLLCAILPAGLPLTKAVGSAFSPSTTVVALRGSAEQIRGTMKRIVKGDPDPATDLTLPQSAQVIVTPSVQASVPAQIGQRSTPVPYASTLPLPIALLGQPYPRGPPAI